MICSERRNMRRELWVAQPRVIEWICSRDGGIGRRSGLKIRRAQKARGGSSPPLGTIPWKRSLAQNASGFRLRAPASLTPAKRLNLKSAGLKKLVGVRVPLSAPYPGREDPL